LSNKNPVELKAGRWMRGARPIGVILGSVVLLLAGLVVVDGGGLPALDPAEPVDAAISLQTAPAPGGQGTAAGSPSQDCRECESQVRDARKELEARIDKDRQDAEGRIDKGMGLAEWILAVMITVFGFLLPLLSGLALNFQIKQARQDAKDEVESLRHKVEQIVQEYYRNFPQFSAMDDRMQKRLSEMKQRMPSEDDFNEVGLFAKMAEIHRQYILDSEITVAAISVFGIGESPSLRARLSAIYGVFARFYNLRDNYLKNLGEADFARAVSYAARVIELDRERPEGYRMRGAIYLDRYRLLKLDLKSTAQDKLEELLNAAEMDLDEAISKCPDEKVDAGAFYNRGLAYYYREDYPAAVAITKRGLGLKDKILRPHRERYLPSIYVNLGSFLAKRALLAAAGGQPDEARQFSTEAVQALTRGVRDFEQTTAQDGGLARLKKELESELDGKQELSELGEPYVTQLWALVKKGPGKTAPAKKAQEAQGEVAGTD